MSFFRRHKAFFVLAAISLIPRLLLSIFNHPWDIQTFYNFFVDLSKNHSPYETMEYLSYSTASHIIPGFNRLGYFEYWAYPPLMALFYWPIAQIYSFFHPGMDYNFVIAYATPILRVPLEFNLFFKLPIFLADIGIAWLLYKMVGKTGAKMFLFNPYVIFIGATWMFESIETFFLILSIYLLREGKLVSSSISLAFGALTKFVPYLIFPIALIYLIKKKVSTADFLKYIFVFVGVNLLVITPFWEGMKFVLGFHSQRMGGNISPYLIFNDINYYLSNKKISEIDLIPIQQFALPALSTMLMGLGILAVYYLYLKKDWSPMRATLIVLLMFFATTRLVNEQYLIILIPMLIWEIFYEPASWKRAFYQLMWAIPLAFALVNVPLLDFSYSLLNYFQINFEVFNRLVNLFSDTSFRRVFLKGLGLTFPLVPALYIVLLITKRKLAWLKNLYT